MSKLDVGVGDEFPLDEGDGDDRHAWKEDYRARRRAWREHRHGHHHMHGHHHHHHGHRWGRRGRHFGGLPMLLILGGLAALFFTHQLTAPIAYGMIGVGAGLLVLMFAGHAIWHWRHRRGFHNTPSEAA
jgi:hypothetical protein